MDGYSAHTPEVIGIPQGMAAFHVQIGGEISGLPGGYSGSLAPLFPTFWVVGGTHGDAMKNALTVTRLSLGASLNGGHVTRISVTVTDKDGRAETSLQFTPSPDSREKRSPAPAPETEETEECRHSWVAGMIYVADEDLDTVAANRPVKCEYCDATYRPQS